jgi:predicted dinucleotide-binding enzyme
MSIRHFVSAVLIAGFLQLTPTVLFAETIAVIGTGSVGSALGPRLADIGHRVVYGSRTPDREDVQALLAATSGDASVSSQPNAAQMADIILLAVPWNVAEDVLVSLGDLSGKIIIDPINPRIVTEDGRVDYPSFISNAERLQILSPRAMVVKAFSSISSDTMIDPGLVDHPITIPLAGNDADAKAVVAEICEGLGFETLDFGPVRYAHIIEGLYLLRGNSRLDGNYFEWNFPESNRTQ